jgi:predicted RNA-binding Zn-ribbon protein involved in translation (DUF1610 family)
MDEQVCGHCGNTIVENSFGEWPCFECGHDNTEDLTKDTDSVVLDDCWED